MIYLLSLLSLFLGYFVALLFNINSGDFIYDFPLFRFVL